MQLADFERLAKDQNLCIAGDYNLSFSDNYYFTTSGRNRLLDSFNKNNIYILTKDLKDCIDHISLSSEFCSKYSMKISEWNLDEKLSDHKGVMISISA